MTTQQILPGAGAPPAVTVAAPTVPAAQLPSTDKVRAELNVAKKDTENTIAGVVAAAFAIAFLATTIMAIGVATGGIGLGVAAIGMAIIIPVCMAGFGGIGALSGEIAQAAMPRELGLLKEHLTPSPTLATRCNEFMRKFHPMDPPTAIPIPLPGTTLPLADAKRTACAKDPTNPPPEKLSDLLIRRKHGDACDFLWDVYIREQNLSDRAELALSIAALTRKTKSVLHHPGYYEQNKDAVRELLQETFAAIQNAQPPEKMSPTDEAGALKALAQMYLLMQQ